MKKVEKYIIMILSVITVAAIGTAVYFGINSTEKKNDNDKVIDINKEVNNNSLNDKTNEKENNKEAIAFCEANKDKIYNKIIENRNNSLAAKYDNKWLDGLPKLTSKDDLNCNYAEEDDYGFYDLYFDSADQTSAGEVRFTDNLASLDEYTLGVEGNEINYDFASYLSHEILGDKWGETNADYWETGILSIYQEELVLVHVVDKNTMFPGELFSLYLVNLKTKTYEKLK